MRNEGGIPRKKRCFMGTGSPILGSSRYEAQGSVQKGGAGRLHAHGLDIAFDGTAGRLEALPGPADVLSAALCACILKNVERFSERLPFAYEAASVEVILEREEPPPRIVRAHYTLRIVTDEPPARLELLHRNIRKFGTITNTVGGPRVSQFGLRITF